ncbi:MAG: MBL fold metallo-hydrolase [Bacteroidales bacterium]|nr:MBL fold metallo-hydrolase [Bacteroidales bacterium]
MNIRNIILSALIITLSIAAGKPLAAQNNNSGFQADQFIKTKKINDKTLLIQMGYDAVTAISTQKGIVVFDAGISTGLTEKYRNIIEKEFQRNDFAYLINTHAHPDHTSGNSVFAGTIIVGHKNCQFEMQKQNKDPEKLKSSLLKIVNDYDRELNNLVPGTTDWNNVLCQRERYQSAYNDLLRNSIVTEPNLTFSDSLDLDLGDEILSLVYFGKAHSESDIIIHIPGKKILMTGDLFSKYGRASIPGENVQFAQDWMGAVDWIERRWSEIDIIISGHGDLLSKEDLLSFVNYVKRNR